MQLNKYPETSENQRKIAKILLTSRDIHFGKRKNLFSDDDEYARFAG